MLLLTFTQHFGAKAYAREEARKAFPVKTTTEAFVTQMELVDAIDWIHEYSQAYRDRYEDLFAEFKLIGVQTIPHLNPSRRMNMQLPLIEDLPRTPDEFD